MRIGMSLIKPLHAKQNSVVAIVINFYATFKHMRSIELTNASFRKLGRCKCQLDLSYYIAAELPLPLRLAVIIWSKSGYFMNVQMCNNIRFLT